MLALLLMAAPAARAQEFGPIPFEMLRLGAAAPGKAVAGKPLLGTPNVSGYKVKGIDVSTYQGDIVWAKVAKAGADFAYIKATEGGDMVDDRFSANWNGARAAGLPRGAYHFYNFCRGGAVQAANFIRTVPEDSAALPPMIDLEDAGGCGVSQRDFLRQFAVFIARLQAAYHRPPILYTTYLVYGKYLSGIAGHYKLWIADTRHSTPILPARQRWAFWQYSFAGHLSGISGAVDLDVFNGTPRDFGLFVGGTALATNP